MTKITLSEYLKNNKIVDAAQVIGVTPAAVRQMIQAGRHIELIFNDDGSVEAIETRRVGNPTNQVA